jgi:hypothetical protein
MKTKRSEAKIHLDEKIWQDLNANQGKNKNQKQYQKKKNTRFLIRVKTRAFFANENEYISSKGNLLGYNHLLQQTNKLNQLIKLKQLTLQEKHIVHEAIKI